MLIEIKNLKIAASLSQETTAYTATIYVDGKPAIHASNNGCGGCDDFHSAKGATVTLAAIEAWIAANEPPYKYDFMDEPRPCDLEYLIIRAMERADAVKLAKRHVKKSLMAFDGDKTLTFKAAPTPANIAALGRQRPTLVVINENPAMFEKLVDQIIENSKAA